MGKTSHSITIEAPLQAVYTQWTRFEDFPHFMEGVEEVRREGERRLYWKVKVGGQIKEWESEITEQVANQLIAWQSVDGTPNSGTVTFAEIGEGVTRVTATIEYEPEGFLEITGDALGIPAARVEADLKRFRDYLEKGNSGPESSQGELEAEVYSEGLRSAPSPKGEMRNPGEQTVSLRQSEVPISIPQTLEMAGGSTIDIPLSEEEVKIGTRVVGAGEVRVHKRVVTEQVNVPVLLRREELVVERIGPKDGSAADGESFREEPIIVPLSQEEVVIEKVTQVTGAVRIRKTEEIETEIVQESVRRESIEIEDNDKV